MSNGAFKAIENATAARYSERHGLVTSFDPKKYLAKVTFQPEGQESGWLPIEAGHIGAGYGIAVGLTPGDGKSTGDQVIVRYQENDFEGGKIVQRVHSDQDTPPTVQSGEMVIWAKFRKSGGGQNSAQGGQGGAGQQIYIKNDGSIMWTDGNGATITFDGAGNATVACKKMTVNASDNIAVTTKKTITLTGQKIILDGETHLGGENGVPASKQGTIDTKGGADVANLAQKVFVT